MHRLSRTTGLVSVGLAAALLISGCSSGGTDRASDKPSDKPSAKAPATSGAPSASTPAQGRGKGTPAASGPASGGIDGDWVAVTQGKPVALVIKGKNASVLGEHLCNGTTSSAAGTATLHLKCPDGNTARTKGTARLNGSTLEVSWAGFGKDEFTRNKTSR
ncbi:hypothetical protein [Streptomyces sp. NPDC001205]